MDGIRFILLLLIGLGFLFFYFKLLRESYIVETLILASFFSHVASISGLDSGKLVGFFFFLLLSMSFGLPQFKKIQYNKKLDATFLFNLSIFCLFVSYIISVIISPAQGYEYFMRKMIFSFLNIFLPVFCISIIPQIKIDAKMLILFFIVQPLLTGLLVFYSVYEAGFTNLVAGNFLKRISAGNANVIWQARFLSIGLIVTVLSNLSKKIKILFSVVYLIGIFFSGSKSVVLFSFFGLIIYFIFYFKEFILKKKNTLITFLVALAATLLLVLRNVNENALINRFSTKSNTINLREMRINSVWKDLLIRENLLFGNGLGTCGFPIEGSYAIRSYPHNILLEVLYELGLFGLIFYLIPLMIPLFLRVKFKIEDKDYNIILILNIVFILYAQTSGDFYTNPVPFILSAYLIKLANKIKK